MTADSKAKATSLKARRERAALVFDELARLYPDAACSLDHKTPLELMVATILSAQCTDARVNIVTKDLFKKYRKAEDYLAVSVAELEGDLKTCGFYRSKTKNIRRACEKLLAQHNGMVPDTLEALVELDGVGRKTANVVLGACFGIPGVVVDTHCGRIARRLGFTKETNPVKVERELMKVWEQKHWSLYSHFMVFHGRAVCPSRSPKCSHCALRPHCPFPGTREGKKICK